MPYMDAMYLRQHTSGPIERQMRENGTQQRSARQSKRRGGGSEGTRRAGMNAPPSVFGNKQSQEVVKREEDGHGDLGDQQVVVLCQHQACIVGLCDI